MRIGLTSIFVDDQDQAERFYTQVLGLQVKTNAPYSDTERWLSVVAPEDPGGVEVVLHLTDEPAREFQAANRELGRPVLSLRTDDCRRDAERLKARGWCSSRSRPGWATAAWMRSSPTAAATCSTSTRTEKPVVQPTRQPEQPEEGRSHADQVDRQRWVDAGDDLHDQAGGVAAIVRWALGASGLPVFPPTSR